MTSTRGKLARIPDLAAEVWLTRDAPNPDGRTEHTKPVWASRPPLSVAVLDALRPIDPDGYSVTPLWHLTQAVRLAWDELRDRGVDTRHLPRPAEQPTFASECGWLLETAGEWEVSADLVVIEMIDWHVNECHGELTRLAREPKPIELWCQTEGCHGRIRPIPVTYDGHTRLQAEMCENGHLIDRHGAVAAKIPPAPVELTARQAAERLGLNVRTIRRWAAANRIAPTGMRARAKLYDLDALTRIHNALKDGGLKTVG